MTILFFNISTITFITGIYIAILVFCNVIQSKIRPATWLIMTVFFSSFVLFIPIYYHMFDGYWLQTIDTILLSIHNAIRLFIVDGEFNIITEHITQDLGWIYKPYTFLSAVLFVFAPILTFGTVLSMLGSVGAYVSFYRNYFNDLIVFSELNEESVILAESMQKNNNTKIIFTDVVRCNDEKAFELTQRARALRAILFKNDIELIPFGFHSKGSNITFCINGHDEYENIRQALALINKYRNRDSTRIIVFSNSKEGGMLLSDADKGKIVVKRVYEKRAIIERFFYDKGKMIFNGAKKNGDKKTINALIIGLGEHGWMFTKTLCWYSQVEGYELNVVALDKDTGKVDAFVAECPELLDGFDTRRSEDGDAKYSITIQEGTDVFKKQFERVLDCFDPTFVFIALGDDSLNIHAATYVRMWLRRKSSIPDADIVTIVHESDINKKLNDSSNSSESEYNIIYIGALKDLYSQEVILGTEEEKEGLENEAFSIHKSYSRGSLKGSYVEKWMKEEQGLTKEKAEERFEAKDKKEQIVEKNEWYIKRVKEFWYKESDYRSSVSKAIFNKALSEVKWKAKDISPKDQEQIRWNAYMRSEGYIRGDEKDLVGKMHHKIKNCKELKEEERTINESLTKEPG